MRFIFDLIALVSQSGRFAQWHDNDNDHDHLLDTTMPFEFLLITRILLLIITLLIITILALVISPLPHYQHQKETTLDTPTKKAIKESEFSSFNHFLSSHSHHVHIN